MSRTIPTELLTEGDHSHRVRFDALVSELLSGFLGAPDAEIDAAIAAGVERVLDALGLDRGGVLLWEGVDGEGAAARAWPGPREPAGPDALPRLPLPWVFDQARRGRTVTACRRGDLPAEGRGDAAALRRAGVRALLALPLNVRGRVAGVLLLGASGDGFEWTDEVLREVRAVAGAFAGELDRVTRTGQLEEQLRFQALLAELTARFLDLPGDRLDAAIEDAQRRFCGHLGLDRSALYQLSNQRTEFLLTHLYQSVPVGELERRIGSEFDYPVYWVKVGAATVFTRLEVGAQFPWCHEQILAARPIVVSSVDDMPTEAATDRESFSRYQTRSTVVIPLSAGGTVIGCLSFAVIRSARTWSEDLVQRFRAIADVFAGALARRRAEDALRRSEERYRGINATLPGAVYQFYARDDGERGVSFIDPQVQRICGIPAEPLDTFFERFVARFPPDEQERLRATVDHSVRTLDPWEFEGRFVKPTGEEMYVRGFSRLWREGAEVRASGMLLDVTDRRRAQEALRARNQYIEAVLERAPIGFAVHTIDDGVGRFVSARFEEIYGAPRGTIVSHDTFFDRVWPSDPELRERVRARVLADMASGDPARMRWENVPVPLPSGHVRYITATNIPLPEQNLVVSTVQDVTERVEAEARLRESEERFRQVAQITNDFIWEIDATGLFTYTSPSVQKILGYAPEELVGKLHFYDLFVPEARDELRTAAFRAFAARQPFRAFPNANLDKAGKVVHLETSGVPVVDADGNLLGYRGADSDVTERKRAEAELGRTLDRLRDLQAQLHEENVVLRTEVATLRQGPTRIVGDGRALRDAMRQAAQVAPTDSTVLVLGETGTGKGLLAQHVHRLSRRAAKPFVTINIAAMPATLMESELFGHERGAYTGALAKRIGRFELADGGTIFLDEIGEMPPETQAKLLRVLQEGEFERLGSSRTIRVNVRVIAATNRDLPRLVREGEFREDLFYRLNVFPIHLPPLREHPEDIPLLVQAFVDELSDTMGKPVLRIHQAEFEALQGYGWPGNIRELRNVVERSMILNQGTELRLIVPSIDDAEEDASVSRVLRDVERRHVSHVLASTKGRIGGPGGAAQILGLKPTTLYSLMKRLGISRRNV